MTIIGHDGKAIDPAKGDAVILKGFFGYRPGEGLREFTAELKELADEEKVALAAGIRDETLTYA